MYFLAVGYSNDFVEVGLTPGLLAEFALRHHFEAHHYSRELLCAVADFGRSKPPYHKGQKPVEEKTRIEPFQCEVHVWWNITIASLS